jgi:4-amino-4-deoxy-L-arabinose transferase-like glycosyltransferase
VAPISRFRVPRVDRWLAAAVVLGLGLRITLALWPLTGGRDFHWQDSASYDYAARSLLDQGALWFSPWQQAKREPGYALFVAGCYAVFGRDALAVRLVQAVLGALLCLVVYALVGDLAAGRRAGRLAAFAVALDPWSALFSILVLTECLYTLLLWVALLLLTGRRGGALCLVSAVVWAAMAGVRSETAAFFLGMGAVALALSRDRRRTAAHLVAAVVGMLLVTGIWTWRNQRVVGSPVFTTLNVGETLYDGLWAGADGTSNKRFMADVIRSAAWNEPDMNEVTRDRHLRRSALEYAWAHPGRVLRLAIVKVARTWSPFFGAREGVGGVVVAAPAAAFLVLVGLGLAGCVRQRRAWRTWVLWAVPAVVITLVHLVIVGSIRYRIPAMPFFAVMAGALWGSTEGVPRMVEQPPLRLRRTQGDTPEGGRSTSKPADGGWRP